MDDKNQPLITQQIRAQPIEKVPISQGNPYDAEQQYKDANHHQQQDQHPNKSHNQNLYQGQPPVYNNQGMPPPGVNRMSAQIQNHPQLIIIQEQLNNNCPICGYNGSYARRSAGCATFSWCVCLFCFTGIFCFWVPFAIDRCWDVQIVCTRCDYIKAIIQANCI